MPIGNLHQKKLAKNITVFIAVLAFMAVIFLVTIIRLKQGSAGGG